MLVTFLVPDLASNILGATRRLAACIPPPHEVQIAGVAQWGTINRMYDDGFPYVRVSAPRPGIAQRPTVWSDSSCT